MSNNLKTEKLGKIGNVSMCKRVLKAQTSSSGEIPFYKISTFGGKATSYISEELFRDYVSKYSFPKKGDVLISAAGTVGKTVIYDGEPAYFQDSNIVWIDNDEALVNNRYLYYFYQTNPWRKSTGSTITRIYNEDLRSLDVIFPEDKSKQTAIANILSELDSEIVLNNKINTELEKTARLIYDYWFTQFDFPDENGKPYKSSGGKMVYSPELKRKIPEGWKVSNIKDAAAIISRGPSLKYTESNGIPVLNQKCIRNGEIELASLQYAMPPKEEKHFVQINDILVNSMGTGTLGRVSRNLSVVDPMLIHNCISYIRTSDKFSPYLIYYVIKQNEKYFETVGSGSTGQTSLNISEIENINFPYPAEELINKYDALISPMWKYIGNIKKMNKELEKLRDWLLPMLMNGQVTIKD